MKQDPRQDGDGVHNKELDAERRRQLEQEAKSIPKPAGSPGEQHRSGPLPNEKK